MAYVSDPDPLARAARLLRQDVRATVGAEYIAEVDREEGVLREEEYDDVADRLVERVQQIFHDLYVDTTWPTCPRQPKHPLWYRDGAWRCEQDGARIAALGALPPRRAAG